MKELISLIFNEGKDLSYEYLEIGIDTLLKDSSILEKIPLINSILLVPKTISSLKEAFLIKKIYRFLYEVKDISYEERSKFIEKNLNGKEQEFCEKLIHYIDKSDDYKKCNYIGKAFRGLIYGEIDLETFFRFIYTIDSCLIEDIEYFLNIELEKFKLENGLFSLKEEINNSQLSKGGLLYKATWGSIGDELRYELGKYGIKFYNFFKIKS